MSKKSGFHRQIWPKSVTHLHGITHIGEYILGPIQFHIPCDIQDVLATVFKILSVSCFCVSIVFDDVYYTLGILNLSH